MIQTRELQPYSRIFYGPYWDNDPKYETKKEEVHYLKNRVQDSHQQSAINNNNRLDQLPCETSCGILTIITNHGSPQTREVNIQLYPK